MQSFGLAEIGSLMHWRLLLSVPEIRVGTSSDENINDIHMTIFCTSVKGRAATFVSCIGVCASSQKCSNNFRIIVCFAHRSLPLLVLCCRVRFGFKQDLHDVLLCPVGSSVQGCF